MDADETKGLDGKLATMIAVAVFALVAVVVGAFVLSFDAITAVSEAAHVAPHLSWLMPVSVDGAMTVGTMSALVLKMLKQNTGYAWFVVLAGVGISVACNALHATQSLGGKVVLDGWQAGAVSAIPAVALALSLHLLIILIEAISDAVGERKGSSAEPRTEMTVEPVRLVEPSRTDEPYEARAPHTEAPRTGPVRAIGSTSVRDPRTEAAALAPAPRTGDMNAPEPARTDAHKPAPAREKVPAKDVKPSKTLVKEQAESVDRDALVEELAREIGTAGDDWRPDYDAMMARAGYGRSWCEKVVKDARVAARDDGHASARTEPPYGARTDDEQTRTASAEPLRTEPARTPLRAVH